MLPNFSDKGTHIHFYSDIVNRRRVYRVDSHFQGVGGSRFIVSTQDKAQLKKFFQDCINVIEEDEKNDTFQAFPVDGSPNDVSDF